MRPFRLANGPSLIFTSSPTVYCTFGTSLPLAASMRARISSISDWRSAAGCSPPTKPMTPATSFTKYQGLLISLPSSPNRRMWMKT